MELFSTLEDCGMNSAVTPTAMSARFPNLLQGTWATQRVGTVFNPNNSYRDEMRAIWEAPLNTPLEMVLGSNLEPLKSNKFIIESIKFESLDGDGNMLPNQQPNNFRPKFVINKHNLFANLEMPIQSFAGQLGLPSSFCTDFSLPFNEMREIFVEGKTTFKDEQGLEHLVPVIVHATFRY